MKQNCSSTDFVDEILIPTITGLVEQYKVSKINVYDNYGNTIFNIAGSPVE